ncbi:MAG TPA: 16S rRNA (adenine(1518)-N(6)/adenine(1519)-N(6))-dimethyltransferase RsmA [Gemmatirosa sp.]|nr:16S rRNA (adenine(1518)-N(6)/adenine(1519)-N(6))-dimethyltransferase RsmA [Gemmatirosa sp.]
MARDDAPPRAGLPRARKRFGQHFLRDRGVLARIVEALQLSGTETVVEIGPGRGALTDLLVDAAARLFAVEIDRDLAAHLRTRYADRAHVTIVEQDVLQVPLGALAGDDFVLAGNVPYYITTPIIFHALQPPRPRRAVYLVQKEVADRITAAPGSKVYGALSVNVQALAEASLVCRVPPGAFVPAPQVDSAVIVLTPRAEPVIAPDEERAFSRFVQEAFGLRRKQLRRVVRSLAPLDAGAAESACVAAGLDGEARPETLAPADFARLLRAVRAAAPLPTPGAPA